MIKFIIIIALLVVATEGAYYAPVEISSDTVEMNGLDLMDKVAPYNLSSLTHTSVEACRRCGVPCTRYCCNPRGTHPQCCTDGHLYCYCCRRRSPL